MSEELSKRIDDLHKRFDDLRTDMGARFSGTDKRIDDLRADLGKRIDDVRSDMTRGFRMMTWMMGIWFSLLTLLTILFKFIR